MTTEKPQKFVTESDNQPQNNARAKFEFLKFLMKTQDMNPRRTR